MGRASIGKAIGTERGMKDMGRHALLAPSAAYRWLNCTKAPRLEAEFPKKTSVLADEGTLAHKVCEATAKLYFKQINEKEYGKHIGSLKADPLWKDEMLETATQYAKYLRKQAGKYNAYPHIEFEKKVDVSAYVPEVFGRCDCVMLGTDTLIIVDYKHGKGAPVSAKQNPQMMLYALGALGIWSDKKKNIRNIKTCIVQPRIGSFDGWKCSVKKLLQWGEDIKGTAQMAFEGKGEFHTGSWCRFCLAYGNCEATIIA